eukprot:654976-Prorocentrum_minimum.AAC.1
MAPALLDATSTLTRLPMGDCQLARKWELPGAGGRVAARPNTTKVVAAAMAYGEASTEHDPRSGGGASVHVDARN